MKNSILVESTLMHYYMFILPSNHGMTNLMYSIERYKKMVYFFVRKSKCKILAIQLSAIPIWFFFLRIGFSHELKEENDTCLDCC